MSYLLNLRKQSGIKRAAKRVGRGVGSGRGFHTVGRGNNGQNARSGGTVPNWFEGGQTPLVRRMPYRRGFINHAAKRVYTVNIADIDRIQKKYHLDTISPDVLRKYGLVCVRNGIKHFSVKVLGRGKLSSTIKMLNMQFSKNARAKLK